MNNGLVLRHTLTASSSALHTNYFLPGTASGIPDRDCGRVFERVICKQQGMHLQSASPIR